MKCKSLLMFFVMTAQAPALAFGVVDRSESYRPTKWVHEGGERRTDMKSLSNADLGSLVMTSVFHPSSEARLSMAASSALDVLQERLFDEDEELSAGARLTLLQLKSDAEALARSSTGARAAYFDYIQKTIVEAISDSNGGRSWTTKCEKLLIEN